MTKQEAIDFCKNNIEVAAKIILMVQDLKNIIAFQEEQIKTQREKINIQEEQINTQEEKINFQELRIKELETKLNMNSKNSSKPPSSDDKLTISKKNKNNKHKRNNRGGQKGREGKNLRMVENPDKIVELKPAVCSYCHQDISESESIDYIKRQLFDIPPVKIEVTEYQAHSVKCPHCNNINQANFPDNIKAPTGYGENIRSFVSYLNTYHMLPYERITQLIQDVFEHKISTGTIFNMLNRTYDNLETPQNSLKQEILQEEVLHSDETSVNVKADLKWVHTVSNDKLTFYHIHNKRGNDAIKDANILPNYNNILTHDFFSSYNHYDNITHSYCNAHLLRELQAEIDTNNYQWAKDMQNLLKTINKEVIKQKEEQQSSLNEEKLKQFEITYSEITKSALDY
jgi:transposase